MRLPHSHQIRRQSGWAGNTFLQQARPAQTGENVHELPLARRVHGSRLTALCNAHTPTKLVCSALKSGIKQGSCGQNSVCGTFWQEAAACRQKVWGMPCRATFLTGVQLAPQAQCQTVVLPADPTCLATPTLATLIAMVNAGSTPGAGGPLSFTLSPLPPAGSTTYILAGGFPAAEYTFELTATNGAGSSTCGALVFVTETKPTAACAPTLTLQAGTDCQAHPTTAVLLADINAGGTPGSGSPIPPSLSPAAPPGGVYNLPTGTFPISLTVSSCVGSDTCSALVTVQEQKPTATCAPPITLAATSGCAAHPTAANLLAAINAGSTPGSGGVPTLTLEPPARAGGVYDIPLGTFPVSLVVSNCAGTDTCSTFVTVTDQEDLKVRRIGWPRASLAPPIVRQLA